MSAVDSSVFIPFPFYRTYINDCKLRLTVETMCFCYAQTCQSLCSECAGHAKHEVFCYKREYTWVFMCPRALNGVYRKLSHWNNIYLY